LIKAKHRAGKQRIRQDKANPTIMHRPHPREGKAKRMIFAEKLLVCASVTMLEDDLVASSNKQHGKYH
jgi:hypothetical protein